MKNIISHEELKVHMMNYLNFLKYFIKHPFYKINYPLILISIFLWGCNNYDSKLIIDGSVSVDITLNQNASINQDQIILKKLIPLETTKDNLIGFINKVIIRGNKLIIVDYVKANSTFCFDMTGKFIKRISNIGRAGGEYLLNRDFIEKTDSTGFYLFDKRQNKLLEFDDKLDFIKERKIPFQINSLIELNNGSFLVERSSEYRFFVNLCNSDFEILKEFIERPKFQLNYDINNPFPFKIGIEGTPNYNPSFSNYIFEYKENKFIIKYFIKDKVGFPNEIFFKSNKGVHPGRIIQRFQEKDFLSFLDFYENNNFLLLKYYRGKDTNISIYNKKTLQVISYNTLDNQGISCILNNVLAMDANGSFISYIFPHQLLESDKNQKLLGILKIKNSDINETNNPIIIFFDIKL